MNRKAIKFDTVADWAYPSVPGYLALFEVFALMGWEGKEIRLSAADQVKIMGFYLFGKQSICIKSDGLVYISRKIAFGNDYTTGVYGIEQIKSAIERKLIIAPDTQSPKHWPGI